MSKYPAVILFRHKTYSHIDNYIHENKENLMCTVHITDKIEDLNKLFNPNYHLLVTYGESYEEYHNCIAKKIPQRFYSRWFHKNDISNINDFNSSVNYCFTSNVIDCRELTRPIFSIFTTCFKSYEYIKTAYESIKKQSLLDWEWVIMDDTPEDSHFDFLKGILSADNRVRLYNRDKNSGNIGNVKNEVISLCRGKYILEMDHDDEIFENCLTDAYNIFRSDENIGFVYGDTIHLFRDGTNYKYDDFICKGYGGYYMEKIAGKWIYVYNTPNINNITLSHLVCLPNHPRMWKRSVLMELESYSEFLPICDDYEILLRTCCSKYKVAKNNKAQYIQYMNDDGNNFSNIRNSEINRIGPYHISPMFYEKHKVHDKMKELDAYEDETYITSQSRIWGRESTYEHKKMNSRINLDYDKQYCIINDAIDDDNIVELYKNGRNDFLFLSNRMTHEELQNKLESLGFDRMKCYSYNDCSDEELIKYFKMMYKNDNCEGEIIQNGKPRVFIIHNNRRGGMEKYVNDIIKIYRNNEYIFINNKEMLYKYTYNNKNDILFIQNLLYTDIKISDIIDLYNKFHYKIVITIHDFLWFCDDIYKHADELQTLYLKEKLNVNELVTNLFQISYKIIMNSQFTYNVYSKYFDTANFIQSYPNDYKIQNDIINVPKITDNYINIGIFSYLDKCKGEKYVNYLRDKYKNNNIHFHIIGENIPPYKETEFYDYIRKYNINGFLLLNELAETYCYLLTKIINSGLPLLYNNYGAIKERLQHNNEHYFKVFDKEEDNECTKTDKTKLSKLEDQFNEFVSYIKNNNGKTEPMFEDYTIIPTKIHDEIFKTDVDNYTLLELNKNRYYVVDNYHYTRSIQFVTYPIDKCVISELVSKNQIWEPFIHRIFEKYIHKESIVLEGGCHIGTHTLKLALLGKQVLAFEPLSESNAILHENIKINNIDNVTIYSEGLSNKTDLVYFEWSAHGNPGASGLSNNPMSKPDWAPTLEQKNPINVITIDSLHLEKLDFIKLDVEGYEINVIEGAINTIKKHRPIITLESYVNLSKCSYSVDHTTSQFKILLDIGYSIHHIQDADFLFLPI
jgi:FkbM family methyltransferase